MSVTDADRIAAAGIPLTLGGREVRVRYTLRSWKEAEDRFGSLEEVLDLLRGLIGEEGAKPVPKRVGTVMPLLWAGLLHEGLTLDEVYELGSIHDLKPYVDAIVASISEGTPGPGPGKDVAAADASLGPTTTTPSPSGMAVAMASSGA
jgi:hypothetical protein